MRVLLTTAWYPNRKVAGDGVFIQKHAQAIARLNEVAVLMVQTDEAISGLRIDIEPLKPSADVNKDDKSLVGVLVYVPKTRFEVPIITGLLRLMWLMTGYIKGYRYIKKHYWNGQRPEVCHVNVLTRAAGLPWLLLKLHRIPYIITEHWTRYARPEAYPNSSLQLRPGRLFVRDASFVCPVSLNLEQAMKKWGLDNKHYSRVGNVVDTELFNLSQSTSSCLGSVQSAGSIIPHFVHVSWMRDPAKNISGILRVLARLQTEGLSFHMDFIGEGNDKEQLIQYAQELGLLSSRFCISNKVSFLPAKSGCKLAAVLQSHDALVMFSNHENQPVSILEALSCGLPVIATRIAAIPGMLAQQRGITVEPRNEDQLFEVLKNFIVLFQNMSEEQRKYRTLALKRHQYVVEHHSPEVIARQFDALYHAASAQK